MLQVIQEYLFIYGRVFISTYSPITIYTYIIYDIKCAGIEECSMKMMNDLNRLGYTYGDNKIETSFVGSVVEFRCEDNTTRIEYDKYDDNSYDYKLTFVCQPTKSFNLPAYNWTQPIEMTYPRCMGWCPKVKPQPPNKTGLYLSHKDQNFRFNLRSSN